MNKIIHKDLAKGRWFELSLCQQMANVGSEAERAMKWKEKGNEGYFLLALYRFIELINLTKNDTKNRDGLKELCRVNELFIDYIFGDNQYHQTKEMWQKYFLAFNFAARVVY